MWGKRSVGEEEREGRLSVGEEKCGGRGVVLLDLRSSLPCVVLVLERVDQFLIFDMVWQAVPFLCHADREEVLSRIEPYILHD